MTLIDSHAHLYFADFENDLPDVIDRAKSEGVNKIINIGIDLETSKKSIELAETYESIVASVGIHPNEASSLANDYIDELIAYIKHPRVVAIGEIGLDYFRDHTPREKQLQILYEQLDLALDLNMPIIVHNRNAWTDMLNVLEDTRYKNKLRGVMHCYSGDSIVARRILDLGLYISFTGVITFKNWKAVDVLRSVPIDRLLLETDCPFMAPVPFRGKRCEPVYVKLICEKIASVLDVPFETIAETTTKNSMHLFGF
ncbi:TatD family hydrolase [candidate division KSB1 bacterium]|nr:TatD family hydrolase [candidate division KSB1 bacterium]